MNSLLRIEADREFRLDLRDKLVPWAQAAGYVRAYTYVGLGNSRSSKAHELLKWQIGRWPRYIVLSSPLLSRRPGWCYEVVIQLRRGPPIAPGKLLRRVQGNVGSDA